MNKNSYGGLFVAFDGPNGVGKSTLIKQVELILSKNNIGVSLTKEPSGTLLGDFTRQIAETLNSESLACLVAADRYQHLSEKIVPQLSAGNIVITDRYVLSSLILQRMDGVDANFILAVNQNIIFPDIQIVVSADESIIIKRLSERSQLTRFEQGERTFEELKFLNEGADILLNLGVRSIVINNSQDLDSNVSLIAEQIMGVMRL